MRTCFSYFINCRPDSVVNRRIVRLPADQRVSVRTQIDKLQSGQWPLARGAGARIVALKTISHQRAMLDSIQFQLITILIVT